MSNEPDNVQDEDEPLTPEEEALLNALMRKAEAGFEAEATATWGPPEVRHRKNQRYASRLVRRHGEQSIRGMLKSLATLDKPRCCESLRNYDLDAEPLEDIIQPFEIYGLCFRVLSISGTEAVVDLGHGYGTCGSGGEFLLERVGSDSFRLKDTLVERIS